MKQKRWLGVLLIVLGILVVLSNVGVLERNFWQLLATYWPVILIIAGLYNMFSNPAGKLGGLIVLLVGAAFLINNLDQVEVFTQVSFWAILLILVGFWFLFRSWMQPAKVDKDSLNLVNIFSGTDSKVVSKEFRGGSSVSIFGGADIDFREAELASGEARFDVFALFGGADIYVPEGWKVVIKGIPLFGGWDDNTKPPSQASGEKKPSTLVVNCLVLFGGLDVNN